MAKRGSAEWWKAEAETARAGVADLLRERDSLAAELAVALRAREEAPPTVGLDMSLVEPALRGSVHRVVSEVCAKTGHSEGALCGLLALQLAASRRLFGVHVLVSQLRHIRGSRL